MYRQLAKFLCITLLVSDFFVAKGSDTLDVARSKLFFDDARMFNIWLCSMNPAGLDLTSMGRINMLNAGYTLDSRQLKSPVEPGLTNGFSLRTTGIKKIGRQTFSGSFGYENEHYRDILFNNTLIFDASNPYVLGDTVAGRQRKEGFYLKGGFSRRISGRLVIGLKADYSNYVGAKMKDPRNLNNISSLEITPGIIYKFGDITAGLSGGPVIFNNEISVSVTENAKYNLFQFMGLGYFKSIRNIYSYSNSYFGRGYQAEAQAGYKDHFLAVKFRSYSESVRYDNTYRLFDGISDRVTVSVLGNSIFRRNNLIHHIQIDAEIDQVSGTEFMQYYEYRAIGYYRYTVVVTKSRTEEKHVYTGYSGLLRYSLTGLRGDTRSYRISAGIFAGFQSTNHYPVSNYGFHNTFNLAPSVFLLKYLDTQAFTIIPQAGAEYRVNILKDMDYTVTDQSIHEFADQDYEFKSSGYLKGNAGITFLRKTASKSIPEYFLDLKGSYMHVPDNGYGLKHNIFFNTSIGLIF